MSRSTFVRQPLAGVAAGYDRMARWYRLAEPAIALPRGLRRKAVARLELKPGDTVLEVGCGTGRNLRLLSDAVGPSGLAVGVDASSGMLAQARQSVSKRAWANVRLMHQDAATLTLGSELNGVLFSLAIRRFPTESRCSTTCGK